MIQLDAATVLLQWAAGGLLFLWVTTRRREVGVGYGWLLRGVYGATAVGAACAGIPCEDVDAVARRIITDGGYGPNFVHRTGHGIGLEEHEDPYIVAGNCERLTRGNAFSIEPGIYVEGKWGARIEDIVVVNAFGPEAINTVDHSLTWTG